VNEIYEMLKEFPFLGDATITLIVVLMILTGRLVPRRYVDDLIKEKDAWHEAYEAQRTVSQEVRSQNSKLLEVNRVTEHLLTSIKQQRSDTL
jgi:hypothetical protein